MSEDGESRRSALTASLESLKEVRRSTQGSIALMGLALVVVIASLVFSVSKLRPLEARAAELQRELSELEAEATELLQRRDALEEEIDDAEARLRARMERRRRRGQGEDRSASALSADLFADWAPTRLQAYDELIDHRDDPELVSALIREARKHRRNPRAVDRALRLLADAEPEALAPHAEEIQRFVDETQPASPEGEASARKLRRRLPRR